MKLHFRSPQNNYAIRASGMKTFSFLRDKGLSQTVDFKGIGNIIYDMFRMWYHIT